MGLDPSVYVHHKTEYRAQGVRTNRETSRMSHSHTHHSFGMAQLGGGAEGCRLFDVAGLYGNLIVKEEITSQSDVIEGGFEM